MPNKYVIAANSYIVRTNITIQVESIQRNATLSSNALRFGGFAMVAAALAPMPKKAPLMP